MVNGGGPQMAAGVSMAMRIGLELVVATMIGAGLGWLGDHYLGTKPWLLLVGLFIGTAAGLLNVYRFIQQQIKEQK